MPGGGEFEPCLGEVGNLNQNSQVFPMEYTCFIFYNGGVERYRFHFREQMSEKKVYKKVTVADLAFYENIYHEMWHLCGAFTSLSMREHGRHASNRHASWH